MATRSSIWIFLLFFSFLLVFVTSIDDRAFVELILACSFFLDRFFDKGLFFASLFRFFLAFLSFFYLGFILSSVGMATRSS